MALPVITARGTVFSTTAATSYATTQTYTPAPDALLIACVVNSLGSSPLDPTTLTGHGVTWTKLTLGTRLIGTTHCMSVWVALAGRSATNAAVTAGFGAVSQTGCAIIEYEVNGAEVSGTAAAAIQQNPTGSNTTGTTGTVTLSARTAAANAQLSFFAHLANEATTPRANWVEDTTVAADGSYNTPATGLAGQYRNDGTFDTTSTATWSTSINWLGVSLEIVAAVVPQLLSVNTDWPNPIRPGRLYTSIVTRPGNNYPAFGQADWPVPRGPVPAIALRTFLDPTKLHLIGQDLFFASPGDGPTYDYPNPVLRVRPVPLVSDRPALVLTTTTAAPFVPADFPNPPRGATPAIALRSWTDPTKLHLIGQDQFFAAPGDGPTYDFPNPTRRVRAALQPDAVPPLLTTTLAVPFAQTDWPVPRGPLASIALRTWTNWPQILSPFTPGDWPNPRGPLAPITLRSWTNPGLQSAPGAPPFAQTDWPNPRRVTSQLSTWHGTTSSDTTPAPGTPFAQTAWPNPRGRAYPYAAVLTITQWRWQGLLDLIPAGIGDWGPAPAGSQSSVALRTLTQNLLENTLAPSGAAPFQPVAWPNPQSRASAALTTIPPSLLVTTLAVAFRQTDWPNPRGATPAMALRTWANPGITTGGFQAAWAHANFLLSGGYVS